MSRKSVPVKVVPQSNAEKSKSRRVKARAIQHLILAQLGCCACGHRDKDVLEYHHIDKRDKLGDISSLASVGALRKMAEEMTKCAVLCCNCHRLIERKRDIGTITPVPVKTVRWAFRQLDETFPLQI